MQIIKDSEIIDNAWIYIDDEQALSAGDICVSLQRWLQDKAEILTIAGKKGIRLNSDDDVLQISNEDLAKLDLIELNFSVFRDGRSFSQARILRKHCNYHGEIRAVGGFLADQVFYLHRVGVNAFQFEDEQQLPLAQSCLNSFSVTYQQSTC